jgi:cell wall-associated NlpC family hydrolase
MSLTAAEIIVEARCWLGTPFAEGQGRCGAGADCAGFVLGVLGACGVRLLRQPSLEAALIAHAGHFEPVSIQPGAIACLSREPGSPPVHLAIITDTGTLLHAHWSQGVVENRLGRWFTARLGLVLFLKGVLPWQP